MFSNLILILSKETASIETKEMSIGKIDVPLNRYYLIVNTKVVSQSLDCKPSEPSISTGT